MSPKTRYLGRIFGPYCLLIGLGMVSRKQATLDAIGGLVHNGPALWMAGVFTVALGLAMVVGHQVWSSGPAIVVTLIGWITLAKGLAAFWLSPGSEVALLARIHYVPWFYAWAGVALLLGIYLTWACFARPDGG